MESTMVRIPFSLKMIKCPKVFSTYHICCDILETCSIFSFVILSGLFSFNVLQSFETFVKFIIYLQFFCWI